MCSSYKKNKNKKFNIDNNNEYGMNNSDKKSYNQNPHMQTFSYGLNA